MTGCSPEVTWLSSGTSRLRVRCDDRLLTTREVLVGWRDDPALRSTYWSALAALGGAGCFWEHPLIDAQTVDDPYECVVIATSELAHVTASFGAFRKVAAAGTDVVVFPNRSGSARLIVPHEHAVGAGDGRDLMSFHRTSPNPLLHTFWSAIGREVLDAIDQDAPFRWLSTHGLGVPWLHVRLEAWPKYFTHVPYLR